MSNQIDDKICTMQSLLDEGTVQWEIDESGCLRLFKSAIGKNYGKEPESDNNEQVQVIEIDGVEYHMIPGTDGPNDCLICQKFIKARDIAEELCLICVESDMMCVKIVKPTTDKEGSKDDCR